MVIFLYNLYIFACYIQTEMYRLYRKMIIFGCLADMFFALDPSNRVIKRLGVYVLPEFVEYQCV